MTSKATYYQLTPKFLDGNPTGLTATVYFPEDKGAPGDIGGQVYFHRNATGAGRWVDANPQDPEVQAIHAALFPERDSMDPSFANIIGMAANRTLFPAEGADSLTLSIEEIDGLPAGVPVLPAGVTATMQGIRSGLAGAASEQQER